MAFDLKTTQNIFWSLTQAPDGIDAALCGLQSTHRETLTSLSDLFHGEEAEARARMEIYAQMYFWRLHDCILEDYPLTAAFLGKEAFERLVADYLLVHPSHNPDVAEAGRQLPPFLKTHPGAAPVARAFLPDLASLEWAQIEVGRESEAPVLQETKVKNLAPERWEDLQLKSIPALRRVESSFDIFALWSGWIQEKNSPEIPAHLSEKQFIVVWRRDYQVLLQTVDLDEAKWLSQLQEGIRFGDLCESLAEEDEESAALRATLLLSHWLRRQLLVDTIGDSRATPCRNVNHGARRHRRAR